MMTTEQRDISQFLSFALGKESFAVDIYRVREVLDYKSITKIPQTPDFMRGVINLRGGVVPVVDMRLKFGLPETERTVNTCIIIVEVNVDGELTVLGALADAVSEVFELGASDIEPAPKIGVHLDTRFLKGMGKRNEKFLLLLDIDRVFSTEEIEMVQAAEQAGSRLLRQEN